MNRRIVIKCIGTLLWILSACMAPSLAVAIIYQQNDVFAFVVSMLILLIVGFAMRNVKPKSNEICAKDGLAIVGLGWIFVSVFCSLPFMISGAIPSFYDALFETVSGFTTTGSTILTNVESVQKGTLFWRSFTHWVGGMGVLVLMLAIIPSAKADTVHMINAESPGPSPEKFVPQVGHMAKILYFIYTGMTTVQILFLIAGGMPIFDAMVHTFGTAGTGGFSIKNAGIAAYNSAYIDIVITVFMLLFGVSFSLYYALLYKRKLKETFRDEEFLLYYGVVIVSTVLIAFNIWHTEFSSLSESFRYSAFQVGSIITTTGYATADFAKWPSFSQNILVMLMFIGACAGSTGGGIKCIRILLLFKVVKREIDRMIHPNAVQSIKVNGHVVEEKKLQSIMAYFFIYMVILFIAVIIVSLDNFDLVTSATAVFTAINNVGPGLGIVGPAGNFAGFSNISKIVLSLCMIIGRLEIYPILLLAAPSLWTRSKMLSK